MSEHAVGWYPGKLWVDANGWTPTDLIFPFFLFIVGVSMALSFGTRQGRCGWRRALLKHVIRRSVLILLIGWFIHLQLGFNFSHMRYPGVLPRIAVVYLCAAVITLWTARRGRIAWTIALLAGYYLSMRFIPGPGSDQPACMPHHSTLTRWAAPNLIFCISS